MYYGYIYKTTIIDNTSKLNMHYYIGKHAKSKFDNNYYGSGKILKDYMKFKGRNKLWVDILEWAESEEELNFLESFYVDEIELNNKLCLNKTIGGNGGSKIKYLTKEEQIKLNKRNGEKIRKYWNDRPEERKRVSIRMKKYLNEHPEVMEKHSKDMKKYYLNPEK